MPNQIKKIGIVGSGNMGRVVGLNWAEKGRQVFFGHHRKEMLAQIKDLAAQYPFKRDLMKMLSAIRILFFIPFVM